MSYDVTISLSGAKNVSVSAVPTAPTAPTEYEPAITAGDVLQYYRGDKTFQNLEQGISAFLPELVNGLITSYLQNVTGFGASKQLTTNASGVIMWRDAVSSSSSSSGFSNGFSNGFN